VHEEKPLPIVRRLRRLTLISATVAAVGLAANKPAWAVGGQLQITVVDKDSGRPIACRMHLRNAAGRPHKPPRVPFWHDHFALPGSITLELQQGNYQFEVEAGPECINVGGHFTMKPFGKDSKRIEIRRFTTMSKEGWWSGDLDIRRPLTDIELLLAAEDIHVAPVATWWNDKSWWAERKLPAAPLVGFDDQRFYHALGGGQNRPGGEWLMLNQAAPLLLAAEKEEYPCPVVQLKLARQAPQGWVDATAPYWWDLPLLIAHGQVDSIEVAHRRMGRETSQASEQGGKARDTALYPGPWGNARWSHDLYFRLLDCGLRIPPSAGSGSGESPNPVGYNRVYVHIEGPLSYEKWWESLRAGRVTATNGPLMRPNVHGELPGHVFTAEKGERLALEPALTLSTRDKITYLEIIKNGQIERSVRFDEYAKSGRLPVLEFEESGWFLLRAVTDVQDTYRFAMTGPYYVEFGGQPRISRQAAQFFLDWVFERARQIRLTDQAQQREVLESHRRARDYWQNLVSRATAE
jgi:hypothetical protein